MTDLLLALLVTIFASPAAAQPIPLSPGTTVITPPKPVAVIEFIAEAGIERWEVKLSGEKATASGETAYLRISGSGCTFMGEIYKGMITPLYDTMTFKTASGRECKVMAIER